MMPNFLIIGTAKAATSALYQYLREHPQVFMPERKELHHFAVHPNASGIHWGVNGHDPNDRYFPIVDRGEYERFFTAAGDARAVGEASPTYMFYTAAAGNIREAIPHARLIALLRDPAERAYSAWLHLVRDGLETLSFEEAIRQEPARMAQGLDAKWLHRSFGFYYEKLAPYYRLFPRDQILVLLQEDLLRSPEQTMAQVYTFLDVDASFIPRYELHHNKTGLPRYPRLHEFVEHGLHSTWAGRLLKAPFPNPVVRRAVTRLKNWNLQKPEAPGGSIRRLRADFREDLVRCQDLIGRDLSHWLAA